MYGFAKIKKLTCILRFSPRFNKTHYRWLEKLIFKIKLINLFYFDCSFQLSSEIESFELILELWSLAKPNESSHLNRHLAFDNTAFFSWVSVNEVTWSVSNAFFFQLKFYWKQANAISIHFSGNRGNKIAKTVHRSQTNILNWLSKR